MNNAKIYNRIAKSLAQLFSVAKLYNFEHSIVREKIKSVYGQISDFMTAEKQSVILAKSAGVFFINGEKIESADRLMEKFIENFVALQLGSIEIEPGISPEEFSIFVHVVCQKEQIIGADKIKDYLAKNKVLRVTARAATFKLVKEDEDIVKKGESVKVEDLPPGVLERFSKDFSGGKVPESLKAEGKDYKVAAHNSTFLAAMTFNLIKKKNAPEDLEKILWLMADYLIDEIGTTKEEDINRKVLSDVKKKLLSMWRDHPDKKQLIGNTEKTCAVINTALELKGLVLLYKKHKKELESVVKKIKQIIDMLPPDSHLCRTTKDDLAGMGFPL